MANMEMPEDYKTGFKYFLGAKIDLSRKPLIPRPETEYWVSLALKEIKGRENPECLDLFSGSGCVGLAVLKNIEEAFCDFGEKEDSFLEQIEINLEINGIAKEKYNIIKTDVFSNIGKQYDFILANPPYVALSRIGEVGEDVREHEPSVALFGGEDGLDLIREFLSRAKEFLKARGVVFMEFDEEQKEEIKHFLGNNYSRADFFQDQFNKYRFLRLEK
ncbi:MAG: HemK family protein methyltransferase [Candidatus Paceibacterota bacterium]|jgi:release factor glutamine methyltransferase